MHILCRFIGETGRPAWIRRFGELWPDHSMTDAADLMTAGDLLQSATARLEDAGIESARRNAEWLLCEALNESRVGLLTRLMEPVPSASVARFAGLLERRLNHEPLQYILGFTEFYGLHLNVSPDVLIPRPETEQVVEEGLRRLDGRPQPRVLDVGTGSGCIALAIKAQRIDARVWGCDISDRALTVAETNAGFNELDVQFFQADALDAGFADKAPSDLDLLISNPPYVSENERDALPGEVMDYEPHLALFSREDPIIFYKHLAAAGLDLLRPGGHIVFETHADFGGAAAEILDRMAYQNVELRNDYSGRPRILRAERSISRK